MNNKVQTPFGAMYPIAKDFTALGYAVIPCHYQKKEAKIKWALYQKQLPTESEISYWFEGKIRNGAVLTGCHGWGAGLVVLDFDNMPDFLNWHKWASKDNPISQNAIDAYMVKTSRGVHVYLSSVYADTFRNLHYGGVDVKGAGGYCMLPGSIHPTNGFQYFAIDDQNYQFPLFERLEQVLPAEILERREKGENLVYSCPSNTELSPLQVLDMPAGKHMTIEQIKARHRIEEFLPVVIKTGSTYFMTKCPFHADEHASMFVDTAKQICGCYAGCTPRVLDVINLYARMMGISNLEAISQLSVF
ncbi:bifunctional DNA primase/polymerase [Syntrophotalea acetylenica]|uniref:bifunctional DNA primase/polymerase n=1 Tax=Syntrophotalea acetylenica TaxID=29542 RepID=UPI002A36D60B|nr:bifunctional DNA primase/polymerase [Syntrophotalea acetylenica]MDY0263510.1 bifunctional DNA primase/polymerase [Syntrophotalea acetylenica]